MGFKPKSSISLFLPNRPIASDCLKHSFGCVVQPLPFLLCEMAKSRFAGGQSAKMDVGGFPSHGVKKAKLSAGSAQGSEFDAGAVGAEAADDPTTTELDKGIGAADGVIDDGLIENFSGTIVILCPVRG